MGDVFTDISITGYNSNPPPDDGTESSANEITWSKHKTKIGDPIKTAVESLVTNTGSAFDKVAGGVTTTAGDYQVLSTDQGKLVKITATGTITTPDATSVGAPFRFEILNNATVAITVDGSGSQTIDGETTISLPAGTGVQLNTDGTNWFTSGRGRIQGTSSFVNPLPRSYLAGLGLSNNGTDADHDIDIAAGEARDTTNAFNFTIAATHTKRIDASWATGSTAGGMASAVSLSADTTYHLFLVDDGSGNTEAGFDTSLTATNLLSDTGGSYYRRIGSVITDGSANILAFSQTGDHFEWDDPPITNINSASSGLSAVTVTCTVPTGISVLANVNVLIGPATNYTSSLNANDEAPSTTAAPLGNVFNPNDPSAGELWKRTNTSGQIRTRNSADVAIRVATLGWIDACGRFD